MIREPKMVRNDGADFEVWSGGVLYQFKSGESRLLDGETAYQILNHQKTPLVEVSIVAGQPVAEPSLPVEDTTSAPVESTPDYASMKYTELRSIASKKGLFKVGMKHAELVSLLHGQ